MVFGLAVLTVQEEEEEEELVKFRVTKGILFWISFIREARM